MTGTPCAVLTGPGKRKVDQAAPAQDLYIGSLFLRRRAYAERIGLPWFILSPRNGLIGPDDVIEPYDLAMIRQPIAYRRAWSGTVVARLDRKLGPAAGRVLEIHAGAAYLDPLAPLLRAAGWAVLAPLHGLNQGQQMAWYADERTGRRGDIPLHRDATQSARGTTGRRVTRQHAGLPKDPDLG